MNRIALIGAASLGVVLTLAGCAGAATGQSDTALTTVTVAHTGIVAEATLQIATDQGYFEEEGLEVKSTIVASPAASVAAVQGGTADFASTPGVIFVNSQAEAIPVRIAAAAYGFPPEAQSGSELAAEYDDTGTYVNPASGITSVEQLAGKTVAVNTRKAQLEAAMTKALLNAGVDPASINWVSLPFATALEALEGGTVDAAILVTPFTLKAEEAGMELLTRPQSHLFGPGANGFWVTSEDTAANDPDMVAGFQRAIYKANAYANEHPEEAMGIGLKMAALDIPVSEAGKIYWPLETNQSDIDTINDSLVELGFLTKPADLEDAILPVAE